MAVIVGSATWSPSEFQKNAPLDSGQPGNAALQRVLDAENRSWFDCKNYLFTRVTNEVAATFNPGLTVTVFRFRAHNPVGLASLRLSVRGRYAGGTGAAVRLNDNGAPIATINLAAATSTQTLLGLVGGLGDRTYTIQVITQAGSTGYAPAIWVSWGTFA